MSWGEKFLVLLTCAVVLGMGYWGLSKRIHPDINKMTHEGQLEAIIVDYVPRGPMTSRRHQPVTRDFEVMSPNGRTFEVAVPEATFPIPGDTIIVDYYSFKGEPQKGQIYKFIEYKKRKKGPNLD